MSRREAPLWRMNDKWTGHEAAFRVRRVLREEKGDNLQGKRIQKQRQRWNALWLKNTMKTGRGKIRSFGFLNLRRFGRIVFDKGQCTLIQIFLRRLFHTHTHTHTHTKAHTHTFFASCRPFSPSEPFGPWKSLHDPFSYLSFILSSTHTHTQSPPPPPCIRSWFSQHVPTVTRNCPLSANRREFFESEKAPASSRP